MSVPNVNQLKASLEALVKELQSDKFMIQEMDDDWVRGYKGGQWDAEFHIEELLSEFFGNKNPKELS